MCHLQHNMKADGTMMLSTVDIVSNCKSHDCWKVDDARGKYFVIDSRVASLSLMSDTNLSRLLRKILHVV